MNKLVRFNGHPSTRRFNHSYNRYEYGWWYIGRFGSQLWKHLSWEGERRQDGTLIH